MPKTRKIEKGNFLPHNIAALVSEYVTHERELIFNGFQKINVLCELSAVFVFCYVQFE